MKKTKSPRWARYKVLLALPLAALLFFIFACTQNESDLFQADDQGKSGESLVYLEPDVMAEFPGGNMEMRRYIASNLKYPKECIENGVQGKVYIQFVIDENGEVEQFVHEKGEGLLPPPPPKDKNKNSQGSTEETGIDAVEATGVVVVAYRPPENVKNSYDPRHIALLEEEALRVILSLPDFKPAMKDGKPVKVMFTLPINFVLQ